MDEPHRDILLDLFHRSRLSTIVTRYLKVEEVDGRLRPTIKLYGAKTGRLSYSDPSLQQWPKEVRYLVQPGAGHIYIAADYSQLEARIMAILAQDRPSLDVLAVGGDIHLQNAFDLFEHDEGTWAHLDPLVQEATRNFAKTFVYGIGYGGDPETLDMKLYCPCPRCVDVVPPTLHLGRNEIRTAGKRWQRKHPQVLEWRSALLDQVISNRHVWVSPFGCHRKFQKPRSEIATEVYNFPMQHCAAMIINAAMGRLQIRRAPMVLQMHDELMLEVPTSEADRWASILKEEMERPVAELGGAVFPVDVKLGTSWGSLTPWEPPPHALTAS
jgi:DNA polymerase-1